MVQNNPKIEAYMLKSVGVGFGFGKMNETIS